MNAAGIAEKIPGMEKEITEHILSLFEKNQSDVAKRYFGLIIDGSESTAAMVDRWDEILDTLERGLKGEAGNEGSFINIINFDNLIEKSVQ